jgi:ubiquinone/menaquinone biosynthesis C-methylase UbiE
MKVNRPEDIFDVEAERYDAWFDTPKGRVLFENELAATRLLWREEFRPALEVGVGTGRFARALGVEFGIDPAAGALRLAERRGIQVKQARGEALPFPDASFGGVLMIATLCFAADPPRLFHEAARVLRPNGRLLIGDIPADSPWGRYYLQRRETGHRFYSQARFFTVDTILRMLGEAGLNASGFSSTLRRDPIDPPKPEKPELRRIDGAGFVCILAEKNSDHVIFHEPMPGARTALSARSHLNQLADKAVRAPLLRWFMALMRDRRIVEAAHGTAALPGPEFTSLLCMKD